MRQSCDSMICWKTMLLMWGSCVWIPNHTRAWCWSSGHDLLYDIVRLWPGSHQERITLIPQLHEHDNQWDLVAIRVRRSHLECKMQHMLLSQLWKAKYGYAWVTPEKLLYKRSHYSHNEKNTLYQRNQQRYLPAKENRYLLLCFYDTNIYLLLYYKIY